jgi:dolichol kinase
MLALGVCLLGLLILLIIAEIVGKKKILKGEYHRKFLHITAGAFIAFWPWLISWRWIEVLGIGMALGMLANYYFGFFNYRGRVGRATYGDIFYAVAITSAAFLTHNKVFFAIAILEVAIADGLAAVSGMAYGKYWTYRIFNHKKTVIGSMVFWIATVCIFSAGLLAAHDLISFQNYFLILLLAPPIFTFAENIAIFGLDNLVLVLLTIGTLRLMQYQEAPISIPAPNTIAPPSITIEIDRQNGILKYL